MNEVPKIIGKVSNILMFRKQWIKYTAVLVLLVATKPMSATDSLSIAKGFELLATGKYNAVLDLSEQLKIQATAQQKSALYYDALNLEANVYMSLEHLDDALAIHHKVLDWRSECFGANSLEVANSCNNLGNCYLKKGNLEASLAYLLDFGQNRPK